MNTAAFSVASIFGRLQEILRFSKYTVNLELSSDLLSSYQVELINRYLVKYAERADALSSNPILARSLLYFKFGPSRIDRNPPLVSF